MVPRRITAALLALSFAALAHGQQGKAPPGAGAGQVTGKQEFHALAGDYQKARRELSRKTQAPKDLEALAAAWVPKFAAGAERHRGEGGAILFLLWILDNDRGAARDAALATLVADHVGSAEFGPAVIAISGMAPTIGGARVNEILAKVIADNHDDDVVAEACLCRARLVLGGGGGKIEDAARQASIADLRRGVAKAKDKALQAQLAGALYEQEHLLPGMRAPEIEGVDLGGAAMKLSEYRGKVVLLDFFGDGLRSCRAMYPHQRALVERFAGKPFAIVGVNSDKDPGKLKQRLLDEKIGWRSFACGADGTRGPIPTQWNVRDWPTIVVLDHDGVIVERWVGDPGKDALDKVLEALVEKAAAATGTPR